MPGNIFGNSRPRYARNAAASSVARELHDVLPVGADRAQRGVDVGVDLHALRLEVAFADRGAGGVHRYLAGDEHDVLGLGLRHVLIGARGLGQPVGIENLDIGHC